MSDERPERPDVEGPDSEHPHPDAGETTEGAATEGTGDRHLDDTFTDAEPLAEHDDAELDLGDATPADDTDVEAQEDPAFDAAADEDPADEDIALSEDAVEPDVDDDGTAAPAEVVAEDEPFEDVDDLEEDDPEEDDLDEGDVDDDSVPPPHAIDADPVEDEHDDLHEDPDDDRRDETRTRSAVAAALAGSALSTPPPGDELRHEPEDDALPLHDGPDEESSTDRHDGAAGIPPTGGEGPSEKRPRRRGRWALLAAVVVLGGLYVGGYFLTGTRMPADASIGGVDVGGLSPAAARAAVDEELTPREGDPVTLTHGDESFEIDPAEAGLALDVDASVDQAGGARSWDPRDMVALFFGSHEHAPALDVDDAALKAAVDGVAEAVDVPVTEALITFPEAKPKPRAPKPGLVVRKDDTAQLVQDQYLVQTDPAKVPTAAVEPAVDEDGLRQAMTEVAEPAVAAPVTIEVGDKDVDLPVTAYAPALTVEPVDGAMAPVIDPEKLAEPLTDATTGIGRKAVDATVEIRDDKPVVVPGKEGVGLQPQEMAEKLVPVLTETGDERTVQVEAKVVEPVFTTEDAKALKIVEKIGEFTTEYPHAEYRNVNQGRAAEILNGTILKPGDTFSFNDTVGERTAANGFTTGSVINNGRFQDELGGGVSQVVTTTYNAAFFAGLEDVEHHPHAFYIDRYPVGREATVYFGSLDLRFRNNLQSGVLIRAFVQKSSPGGVGRTTVQMWGTKEFEVKAGKSERRNFRAPATRYDDSDDCVPQAPLQGFDIDIYRTLSKGGKIVKRETDTANYQAAARIVCGEEPKDD
ncbi:VanW family protein [Aeromicrobium sp.]|uniref:VanW family protein n=1 Tax=Aeromicrobium sp. TaxID=1871063 RepID=UPI0040339A50